MGRRTVEKHGKVQRAYIGVMAQDIDSGLAESLGLDTPHGALIAEITKGSPAEKAGLRVQDVVTELNGEQITNTRKLMAVAEKLKVGQSTRSNSFEKASPWRSKSPWRNYPNDCAAQETGGIEPEDSSKDTAVDELGISVRPVTPELADELGLGDVRGVVISSVKRDSYAASLGIQVGDVIFRMGSVDVNTPADVRMELMRQRKINAFCCTSKRRPEPDSSVFLWLRSRNKSGSGRRLRWSMRRPYRVLRDLTARRIFDAIQTTFRQETCLRNTDAFACVVE